MSVEKQHNSTVDRDAQLILKIASGDKLAFEKLCQLYGERIFRYAYRITADNSKAEEVTNDVLLELWKNAATFGGRSKVSTWLLGIARNIAFNAIRRKQVETVDIDETAPVESNDPSIDRDLDHQTLQQGLRQALAKLSPEHRDVVELTFFHGCSYQEIADIVGCPTNTVKTRMFHARKLLQGLLVEQNLSPHTVEMTS